MVETSLGRDKAFGNKATKNSHYEVSSAHISRAQPVTFFFLESASVRVETICRILKGFGLEPAVSIGVLNQLLLSYHVLGILDPAGCPMPDI